MKTKSSILALLLQTSERNKTDDLNVIQYILSNSTNSKSMARNNKWFVDWIIAMNGFECQKKHLDIFDGLTNPMVSFWCQITDSMRLTHMPIVYQNNTITKRESHRIATYYSSSSSVRLNPYNITKRFAANLIYIFLRSVNDCSLPPRFFIVSLLRRLMFCTKIRLLWSLSVCLSVAFFAVNERRKI